MQDALESRIFLLQLAAGEAAAWKDPELSGFFQNCFKTNPRGGMQQGWQGAAAVKD